MFQSLLTEIEACKICEKSLVHGARPVLSVAENSKILIVGQAPGAKVHDSGIPWDDQSGKNLRNWLGVTTEQFYSKDLFAIVPMGFCYPGKGKSGDLPPRKECAPQWHEPLLSQMSNIELTLLIGAYSQNYYLDSPKKTLTETVQNFEEYFPKYFVLPHPSPRNSIWMAKNQWFESEVLPVLKLKILELLNQ